MIIRKTKNVNQLLKNEAYLVILFVVIDSISFYCFWLYLQNNLLQINYIYILLFTLSSNLDLLSNLLKGFEKKKLKFQDNLTLCGLSKFHGLKYSYIYIYIDLYIYICIYVYIH